MEYLECCAFGMLTEKDLQTLLGDGDFADFWFYGEVMEYFEGGGGAFEKGFLDGVAGFSGEVDVEVDPGPIGFEDPDTFAGAVVLWGDAGLDDQVGASSGEARVEFQHLNIPIVIRDGTQHDTQRRLAAGRGQA